VPTVVNPSGTTAVATPLASVTRVVVAVVLVEVESDCFIGYRSAAAGFQRSSHGRIFRRKGRLLLGPSAVVAVLRANRDRCGGEIVVRIGIERGFIGDVCRVADDGPVRQIALCGRR